MNVSRISSILAVALVAVTQATAAQTQVTARNQISPAATLNWGTVAPQLVTLPASFPASAGFLGVTVTTDASYAHDCPEVTCWNGAFSPGENILANTNGTFVDLLFSQAVTGVATQMWGIHEGGLGVTVEEFLGGVQVYSYNEGIGGGYAPNDGSAPTIGVRDVAGFDEIRFVGSDEFGINQVGIEATSTPEPASLVLMATGLVGVGAWRRGKGRATADL